MRPATLVIVLLTQLVGCDGNETVCLYKDGDRAMCQTGAQFCYEDTTRTTCYEGRREVNGAAGSCQEVCSVEPGIGVVRQAVAIPGTIVAEPMPPGDTNCVSSSTSALMEGTPVTSPEPPVTSDPGGGGSSGSSGSGGGDYGGCGTGSDPYCSTCFACQFICLLLGGSCSVICAIPCAMC